MGRFVEGRRRLLGFLMAAASAGATGFGCAEPFTHQNPYDIETPLELELLALQDSAFAVDEIVAFQLVTEPAHWIGVIGWHSTRPDLLVPLGLGRFRVVARPPTHTTVVVSATVGRRSATAAIVVVGQ